MSAEGSEYRISDYRKQAGDARREAELVTDGCARGLTAATASTVASAGDVNIDGFADLIIGGERADPHGSESRATYAAYGPARDSAVDQGSLSTSTFD